MQLNDRRVVSLLSDGTREEQTNRVAKAGKRQEAAFLNRPTEQVKWTRQTLYLLGRRIRLKQDAARLLILRRMSGH